MIGLAEGLTILGGMVICLGVAYLSLPAAAIVAGTMMLLGGLTIAAAEARDEGRRGRDQ
jgi:hypothetical protein